MDRAQNAKETSPDHGRSQSFGKKSPLQVKSRTMKRAQKRSKGRK